MRLAHAHACTSSTSPETMSVSLNTFICSPVAASSRYEHPAPHPTAAPSRELGYHFSAQVLSTRVVFAVSRADAPRLTRATPVCAPSASPLALAPGLESPRVSPRRASPSPAPNASSARPAARRSARRNGRRAGCATRRRASRRAFVAATGLVPLLFFRDESSAAPSPTNVDDMEARKMAREEMLKAARAPPRRQAAAEAGTAAPAPAPASG